MRNYIFVKSFLLVVLIFLLPAIVEAQATRTWVSGVGDDVNPCSRTAPCKTFAGAISKTGVNGEINCLDPGGYGTVTITKSITIDCTGTLGGVLAAGTNGFIINITSEADTKKAVKLRGLDINGSATGINGIRIVAAQSVNIENTLIDGFTQHGVSIEAPTGTKVVLDNSIIRSNTGNAINSIASDKQASITINRSQLSHNAIGLNVSGNIKAVIKDSIITGNGSGLVAAQSELNVTGCSISNNTTGITSGAGGTIRISGNMITGNDTGLSVAKGSIISFGNNTINGNATNGTPTSTLGLM